MRVAVLTKYESKGPSSRLRFYQFEKEFNERGIELVFYPLFGDDYVDGLVSGKRKGAGYILLRYFKRFLNLYRIRRGAFDLIWLEKELFPWIPVVFEQLALPRSIPLLLDFDDAVFNLYRYHRFAVLRFLLKDKIQRLMKRASGVVSGSRYLNDFAREQEVANRTLIPTCVRISDYQSSDRERSDEPVVGWIGTPSSAANLELIRPALNQVAREHPFRFIAVGAPDLKWEKEAFAFEYVPWSESTEAELIRSFDVGVMPLSETPFNQGKCGFKLIQYLACSVPVIASSCGENKFIVESGVDGLLADTSEDWSQALRVLLQDRETSARMGKVGRDKISEHYSVEKQFDKLLDFLTRCTG